MRVKAIKTEWFQDYKKPSMYIAFPNCNFKCEKECGKRVCQNSALAKSSDFGITTYSLCIKYLSNPISEAIVCGGLEPMDSFEEMYSFIYTLRFLYECDDDVVIYTGYTKEECQQNDWLKQLAHLGNIIIKFGRYVPDQQPHFDKVLGVNLASDNQYAERIS